MFNSYVTIKPITKVSTEILQDIENDQHSVKTLLMSKYIYMYQVLIQSIKLGLCSSGMLRSLIHTNQRCVTSQNSEDLIYTTVEA